MGFRADEHSRRQVEGIDRANKWIIDQFYEIFRDRGQGCGDTKAAIDGSFLIPTVAEIFYLCSVASLPPVHLPDDLILLGVDEKPKASVKPKLIKIYAERKDFGGKRFPEHFVLRFCAKRRGCAENSIRPVLKALGKLAMIEHKESEYTGVTDCEFDDYLLKIAHDYYKMQRFDPKIPHR